MYRLVPRAALVAALGSLATCVVASAGQAAPAVPPGLVTPTSALALSADDADAVVADSPPPTASGDVTAPSPKSAALQRDRWTISPGPVPPGLSAASRVEEVIAPVAENISELGAARGFAGLRTDYQRRSLTLRWKGRVPDDVKRLAAELDVTLKVIGGADYSRLELEAGRDAVLNARIARRLGIVTTDLDDDANGFRIGISGATAPSKRDMAELQRISGVKKISVDLRVGPAQGYATRANDSSPWKGGARIEATDGGCSSGFAVLVGNSGRLLSARHCDPSGNGSIKDGGGTTIASGGSSVAVIGKIDSMLIDPSASPATAPKIYRGAYGSGSTSTVKSWYSNWPGDPVCTSGASTGEHCGTVYDDSDTINLNGYDINVVQVKAPTGSIMGGEGDSGGAMFKKVSGGVQARGILLGPDVEFGQTRSCGTVDPELPPISCSRYINYVPISTILNTWGVRLETG